MQKVFFSERIDFNKLDERLIGEYLIMVNDLENVGRLIGRTDLISEEKEVKWVRRKLEEGAPIFSMTERESGDFIGNIELMGATETEAELGIAITLKKQELGYGSEAISAMVEYARSGMGLKRLFLKVFPFNARAIHVYKKCGFREFDRTERDVLMEIDL